MSDYSIERMRSVRAEFYAAREAISYVNNNWNKYNISEDIKIIGPRDLSAASVPIEATYFVRLFAEFEGVLKEHLLKHEPLLKIEKDVKVDWLISKACKLSNLKIDIILRARINAIREYRNSIAHKALPVTSVTFAEALAALNTFLVKLPD